MYARWYEVLAPYFCRAGAASEALLAACRQLWGQPFTAPTYALLLHQWLLVHPAAGGADQRLKHLNVLVSGARQLFVGDVETGGAAFLPLYAFIAEQVRGGEGGGAAGSFGGERRGSGFVAGTVPFSLSHLDRGLPLPLLPAACRLCWRRTGDV